MTRTQFAQPAPGRRPHRPRAPRCRQGAAARRRPDHGAHTDHGDRRGAARRRRRATPCSPTVRAWRTRAGSGSRFPPDGASVRFGLAHVTIVRRRSSTGSSTSGSAGLRSTCVSSCPSRSPGPRSPPSAGRSGRSMRPRSSPRRCGWDSGRSSCGSSFAPTAIRPRSPARRDAGRRGLRLALRDRRATRRRRRRTVAFLGPVGTFSEIAARQAAALVGWPDAALVACEGFDASSVPSSAAMPRSGCCRSSTRRRVSSSLPRRACCAAGGLSPAGSSTSRSGSTPTPSTTTSQALGPFARRLQPPAGLPPVRPLHRAARLAAVACDSTAAACARAADANATGSPSRPAARPAHLDSSPSSGTSATSRGC